MTARVANPMSRQESGRLGGLARAARTSLEERRMWGTRGGLTTLERHGKYHFVRIGYIRAGRLPAGPASTQKGPVASDATGPKQDTRLN